MFHSKLYSMLVLYSVLCLATGPLAADEPPKAAPDKPSVDPKLMAELEPSLLAAMPGPEHKNLEAMVGKWDVSGRIWLDPSAPPEETRGTSSTRSVLGGRFVHSEYSGQMLGQPFEGLGYTGYDNIAKKYVGMWIDTWGTGLMVLTGQYDEAKKVFSFDTEVALPDGTSFKLRQVIQVVSADEHVMTFYETRKDQPERRTMELTYRRASAGAGNASAAR